VLNSLYKTNDFDACPIHVNKHLASRISVATYTDDIILKSCKFGDNNVGTCSFVKSFLNSSLSSQANIEFSVGQEIVYNHLRGHGWGLY